MTLLSKLGDLVIANLSFDHIDDTRRPASGGVSVECMASTPFSSLEDYIALPRVEALALSPDGTRAVLTVATLEKDGTAYERSPWSVPADGSGWPRG